MRRRALVLGMLCGAAAGLRAQDDVARPRLKISQRELNRALAERFPRRVVLAGVIDLLVDVPRLRLLPDPQRIAATFSARLGDAAAGEVDVTFALRYNAGDRTLRAYDVRVIDSRWPMLAADAAQTLSALLPELAREAFAEVVLHRFSRDDFALADAMGFEPRTITVTQDALVVGFGPKPMR